MTQGDFLAFVVAAFMMYTPIKRLSRVNTNLQQAMAASERIFEMLDTHSEVAERPGAARAGAAPAGDRVPERELCLRGRSERVRRLRAARRVVPGRAPGR